MIIVPYWATGDSVGKYTLTGTPSYVVSISRTPIIVKSVTFTYENATGQDTVLHNSETWGIGYWGQATDQSGFTNGYFYMSGDPSTDCIYQKHYFLGDGGMNVNELFIPNGSSTPTTGLKYTVLIQVG